MKLNIKLILTIILLILLLAVNFSSHMGDSILVKYTLNNDDNLIIDLPKDLKEVSGLAVLSENQILTHNDEEGIVFKIDLSKGKVVSEYSIGKKEIEKDFEGIAVVKDSVYLVTSSGTIYKFSLKDGEEEIEYEKIKTPLSEKNNIEGLCFDEVSYSLLLSCKDYPGKEYKDQKAVYEFNLVGMKFKEKPKFLISLKELKKEFDIKDFSPSGIETNPINGNVFVISANNEAIIELDGKGILLDAVKLDNKKYKQPEGITFLNDGSMLIANESKGKKAGITIIPFNK